MIIIFFYDNKRGGDISLKKKYHITVSIHLQVCLWNMARTNLKYVQQSGLGKGKSIEHMKMMAYKEIREKSEEKEEEDEIENLLHPVVQGERRERG